MDLRHYDNVAHDLNASYEDVQDGMSTPYGIARTTTLTLIPQGGYAGKRLLPILLNRFLSPGYCCPRRIIFMRNKLLVYGVFQIGVLLSVPG